MSSLIAVKNVNEQEEERRQFHNFVNSIRSATTKKSYLWYLDKYKEFLRINEKPLIIQDSKIVENQVIDFLLSEKQRGLSYNSVTTSLNAIAHFYTMNDIVLNRKKIKKFIDTDQRKKTRNLGYTSEQIHKILDVCDERTKAMVLLYASTGMRLDALLSIKLGDLKSVKIDNDNSNPEIYEITIYQGYREEYITFCTPECAKVINSYLDYRKRAGETLKPDTPLIREQFNASDLFKVKNPKAIGQKTIVKTLRNKAIQAGIRETEHIGSEKGSRIRKDVQLVHGFRKFFNTALMNTDVHPIFKELLMGHSVKLDDFYYDKDSKKSREKLLDEYSKAIDALTINEENRLKIKVQELTEREDKLMQLKMEMDELREMMKSK